MTGISQDLSSWRLRTTQPVRMGHAPHSFPTNGRPKTRPTSSTAVGGQVTCPLSHRFWTKGSTSTPATIFVGETGLGQSGLAEAIALAMACSREGGSARARHSTRSTESILADHLQLVRNAGATRRGYFLRAETMHGFFTYLEKNPSTVGTDISFHDMSHGESFLELAVDRFRGRGLWVLDEPESALSFAGCLSLLAVLKRSPRRRFLSSHRCPHTPLFVTLDAGLARSVQGL